MGTFGPMGSWHGHVFG